MNHHSTVFFICFSHLFNLLVPLFENVQHHHPQVKPDGILYKANHTTLTSSQKLAPSANAIVIRGIHQDMIINFTAKKITVIDHT